MLPVLSCSPRRHSGSRSWGDAAEPGSHAAPCGCPSPPWSLGTKPSPRGPKRRAQRWVRPLCWCFLLPLPCSQLLRFPLSTESTVPALLPLPKERCKSVQIQCNSAYQGARGHKTALSCLKLRANNELSCQKVKLLGCSFSLPCLLELYSLCIDNGRVCTYSVLILFLITIFTLTLGTQGSCQLLGVFIV